MQPDSAVRGEEVTDVTRLCPNCSTLTARLFSVALKRSERTLTYHCAKCKQEWSVIDFCPDKTRPNE